MNLKSQASLEYIFLIGGSLLIVSTVIYLIKTGIFGGG